MRVLLFVQAGSERPKVARLRYQAWLKRGDGTAISDQRIGEHAVRWAPDGWDRWWLVECENADAGRAAIAQHDLGLAMLPFRNGVARTEFPEGRILASGGKP